VCKTMFANRIVVLMTVFFLFATIVQFASISNFGMKREKTIVPEDLLIDQQYYLLSEIKSRKLSHRVASVVLPLKGLHHEEAELSSVSCGCIQFTTNGLKRVVGERWRSGDALFAAELSFEMPKPGGTIDRNAVISFYNEVSSNPVASKRIRVRTGVFLDINPIPSQIAWQAGGSNIDAEVSVDLISRNQNSHVLVDPEPNIVADVRRRRDVEKLEWGGYCHRFRVRLVVVDAEKEAPREVVVRSTTNLDVFARIQISNSSILMRNEN
jgi:hypothetical protein